MARFYTTNSLIESVLRRASIPYTQNTFKEDDFLAFANEEMDIGLVPHILSFHEDYLMTYEYFPLISKITRYPLPSRAIGNKLRDVFYVDGSGTSYELTRVTVEDIPYFQYGSLGAVTNPLRAFYIEGNELVLLPNSDFDVPQGTLRFHYYRRPNQLVSESRVATITSVDYLNGLVKIDSIPDNFTSDALFDITSAKSPFNLVAVDLPANDFPTTLNKTFTFGTPRIMQITAPAKANIHTGAYLFVEDRTAYPKKQYAFWMDLTGSDPQPFIQGYTNLIYVRVNLATAVTSSDVATALNTALALNLTSLITESVSGDIVTLAGAGNAISVGNNFNAFGFGSINMVQVGSVTIPPHVAKNDIIALAEETKIPQVPVELQSILAQRIAARCLESMGDTQGLQAAMLKIQEMEQKAGSVIDDRVEGAPLKVANRHSFLNTTKRYIRR